ncbi:MAG: family 1 glycosylhydrolase, partial [Acidimicrobiales bacterium]
MTSAQPEFGVVLTATELEGCSPAADWSRWLARGRAPDSKRGTSATGFGDSYAEDLEQLAGLGAKTLTITLEWAELEPQQDQHDDPAIEFRRDVIRTASELGFTVWGCLVDGTLPGWFAEDEGGFDDHTARGLVWPRHIDWIGETFGDLVDGWIPQREPLRWALRRNLLGVAPPGRRDLAKAANAVQNAMLAEGEAWRLLKGTAPVATYQTARQIYAEPDDLEARPLAAGLERLLWHPWISVLTEGRLVVGDLPMKTVDHLRDAFDRIVVELRPSIRVDGKGRWLHHPADQAPGPNGLTMWPEAQAEAIHRVTDELDGRPIVAAGNLGDVTDDGMARPDHQQAMMA